ncbi:MAG TPA: hypothetical protein VHB79_36595 [Polyangiaceae bacterium]|nr:hypothetical protein [Polyangiaceae bacterium]
MRSHPARGAVIWLLLAPSLSLAAPSPASSSAALGLRWSDPGSLSPTTEAEFDARLSERLGHAAFDATVSEQALSVVWQGSAEQCQVELSLVHGAEVQGTRLLQSPSGDCSSLVPALLTVAALLVEAQQAQPAPTATPAEAPPPPPPPPAASVSVAPERASPLVLVSLGGAVASGFAPKVELAPAAAIVWVPWAPLRVGAEGELFFAHQYGNGPGFSLAHDRLALLLCGMPQQGNVALGLCANFAYHRSTTEGISLAHAETHDANTFSVGAGLRAEWRLTSHLWWVAHAGADVALRQLYFYYTPSPGGEVTLFRQQRVMPQALLGLTLELP